MALRLCVHHALKRFYVQNFNVALLHFYNAVVYKFRECSADGFKFEAQVAANFFARHAQNQLGL